MNDVTRILAAIEDGDSEAAGRLMPMVYDELRRLADVKLAGEKPGLTLQATALVHEAYLRLVDVKEAKHWDSRGHFFAAAAEAMRRILVEQARKRNRREAIRGKQVPLDGLASAEAFPGEQLLVLDDALRALEDRNPSAARLVKLRFFAGLTVEQTAELLGQSRRTVERNWTYARAWLHRALEEPGA